MAGNAARTIAERQGRIAEDNALRFLKKRGLKIIVRNYRCRHGEIDLIMTDQEQLVFVEVRYRKHNTFGSGADTIDHRKQHKLILAANHYLSAKNQHHLACRFDVISINGSIQAENIDWISNAFIC